MNNLSQNLFGFFGRALAQGRTTQTDWGDFRNISEMVVAVFAWAIPISATLALIMFVYAGYLYMTSQGNQDNIKTAKEIIVGTITGIILLFTIRILLQNVIGVAPNP